MMLAQEAARLISDHGIEDYRNAKIKASENLGLSKYGALPNNIEIEHALAERNRIFGSMYHADLLANLRSTALSVMRDLQLFGPCLVGPCAQRQCDPALINQSAPLLRHVGNCRHAITGSGC